MKIFRILTAALLAFTCPMLAAAPLELRVKSDYEGGVSAHAAGNIKMAIIFFQQGADKGDAKSMVALGSFHHFGEGVPKDLLKAKSLYEQAAALGSPDANTMLGIMHREGQGIPADKPRAAEYFKAAALACSDMAQEKLAQMLFAADGVPEDKLEALAWLYLAARTPANRDAAEGVPFVEKALTANQVEAAKTRRDEIAKTLKCPA